MRLSVWRLPSIAAVVLAIFSLSAAAQTCVVPNPNMQSDDKVNLRAQPTTQSQILAQLADNEEKLDFLGKQGNWFHVRRLYSGRHVDGYIHKSQGYLLHSYIVSSRDGYANVREAYKSGVEMGEPPIGKLRTGTQVWVRPEWNEGNWLYVIKPLEGLVHKSQLRRATSGYCQ